MSVVASLLQSETDIENIDTVSCDSDTTLSTTHYSHKKIFNDLIKNSINNFEKKSNHENINIPPNINDYNIHDIIKYNTGYNLGSKIADTLQGAIYHIKNEKNEYAVVKRTEMYLHKRKIGKTKDEEHKLVFVSENIINEANILQYLNNLNNKPKTVLKFIKFFNDGYNYWLLMENGGINLFDHIIYCHKLIKEKKLSFKQWFKHVDILFGQLIEYFNWLHNHFIIFFDISLCNMTIKGCKIRQGKFVNHGQIKIIDYGLARMLKKNMYGKKCKNYSVGKLPYLSPNVKNGIQYNPFKADVWCLGVCLFLILFKCWPFGENGFSKDRSSNKAIIEIGVSAWVYKHKKYLLYTRIKYEKMFEVMLVNENKRYLMKNIQKKWIELNKKD